jgi:hypothetical protein
LVDFVEEFAEVLHREGDALGVDGVIEEIEVCELLG